MPRSVTPSSTSPGSGRVPSAALRRAKRCPGPGPTAKRHNRLGVRAPAQGLPGQQMMLLDISQGGRETSDIISVEETGVTTESTDRNGNSTES
ncbi:hypothetical protein NHX12_032307 [Muraenolepis orangiensis]|uniref:Uncharacterized protein n=1 Tax=Muraenolepis orangiensis TaxID=630683 RepID=A0A9Q0E8P6_9TELE|nr:hypothetical protein NHX12_032307 [Muraenolepis orangiensis]